jgi:hypothetical protein
MKQIGFTNQGARDIQAYIEYRNIVGNDDNGKLLSEEEYEAYKAKVADARKNHLYVFWVNSDGFECKAIGPESMCFCNHRFRNHDFDSVKDKKVKCKDKKCKCKLFNYVPVYGANDVKCLCHHSYREHELAPTKKCKRPNCKCTKFGSKFTCNCGMGYDQHKTKIYTKEERQSMGKPVEPGWFGGNLMAGAGGMNNIGEMMNDVYEQEFQALSKAPGEKKVLYSGGKPVEQGMNKQQQQSIKKESEFVTFKELANKPCKYFGNK